MFRNQLRPSLALCAILFSLLTLAAGSVSASTSCESALRLDPNVVIRSQKATAGLRVEVPSTGVLTVEFSRRAQIAVVPDPCGAPPADAFVAERSGEHLVLAVRTPGALFLQISTAGPRFRAASHFTEARLVIEHFDLDGRTARRMNFFADEPLPEWTFAQGDPEDIDPDPDGRLDDKRPLATFLTVEISPRRKREQAF